MLIKKFSIYVPSTVDVDKPVDNAEYVEKTCRFLADSFGGCTSYKASGKWISADGNLVSEDVTICYAYCKMADYFKSISAVKKFARELCAEMSQEAISVEFNGKLAFIS